jgi:hypothetical protein
VSGSAALDEKEIAEKQISKIRIRDMNLEFKI